MHGYLIVRGGGARAWQRKYVVLRNSKGELRFFENEQAAKNNEPAETVVVTHFRVDIPSKNAGKKYPFFMQHRKSGQRYYLVSDTEQNRRKWMALTKPHPVPFPEIRFIHLAP